MIRYWHASLVSDKKNKGILVIGSPNVGKTEFCHHLLKYFDYYLIADDLVKIVKSNGIYEGFLCNNNYWGLIYHRQDGLIHVERALERCIISHVIYLYRQHIDEKYYKKAASLPLPVIAIDVYRKSWHDCAKQLQNTLG